MPAAPRSSAVSAGVVIRSPRCSMITSAGIRSRHRLIPGGGIRSVGLATEIVVTVSSGQKVTLAAAAPTITPRPDHKAAARIRVSTSVASSATA